MSSPGTTNTCTAKKRESVAPAMIGPPNMSFTIAGPTIGTRLAIDAPIPRPQYASWSNRSTCPRSEEHTSELQSPDHLVCRLLLEKKKIFNLSESASLQTAVHYRAVRPVR